MSTDAAPSPLTTLDCGDALLRPWCGGDLSSLGANASHADVSRGFRHSFPYPYTGADGRAWLARAIDETDRNWAIEFEGVAVGGVRLHTGRDVPQYSAELGFWLGRRNWRRGIMSGVLSRFVPKAMSTLQLHRLFATVYASNPAAARVLQKAGFERAGFQKRAIVERGEPLDFLVYARLRAAPDKPLSGGFRGA